MKRRKKIDVTNRTSAVYTKINIELLWLIKLGTYYDEN